MILLTKPILDHFIKFEGKVNHFYLDTAGVVTVGIGCAVFDVASVLDLDWKMETGEPASESAIKEDFAKVSAATKGYSATFYELYTSCRLNEECINELFEIKFLEFEKGLTEIFPEYLFYYDEVKRVLLDMAFNLGLAGLKEKFPKFCAAIKVKDFLTASKECERRGIGTARNAWAKKTLEELEAAKGV